jgi:hypothetical protein
MGKEAPRWFGEDSLKDGRGRKKAPEKLSEID